ncbi:pentapeptide repeat-containing protein [Okeania sp.]|uniref:pentapeptide repeat-containing protein n=1 Tax=Okeania sp. TaxID=3100323 RepID=UPI0035C8FF2F
MNFKQQKTFQILVSFVCSLALYIVAMGTITAITFTKAIPTLADEYDKQILVGVDFSGRDLTNDSFTKSILRKSDLSNSNLSGVSLFGAHLEGANLEGANLSYSTLDNAIFNKANLTNAILEGAFAFHTQFRGAIIDGADFTDAFLREDTQKELCKIAEGTNPITGNETRDTLFCD